MMKKINFIILLLCLAGCTLADLRGELIWDETVPVDKSTRAELIIKSVRQQMGSDKLSSATGLTIDLTDAWTSDVIRRLTPVKISKQPLRFEITMPQKYVAMTYLDGPGKGETLGIDEKGIYRPIKGVKTHKRFKDIELYVPHMRDYFLWPHILIDYPVKAFVGETILNHKLYYKIFVTKGNLIPNKLEDQYILWVNVDTKQIDYIEFTMRQVMSSLQGAVAYCDFKKVNEVTMPYSLTLLNDIYEEGASHQVVVTNMEIKR